MLQTYHSAAIMHAFTWRAVLQILRTRDSVIAVLQQGLPAKYDDITASQEFLKVVEPAPTTSSFGLHDVTSL